MKIIGLGNALVDILIRMKDDTLLNEFNLPKGSMQLVDPVLASKVLDKADKSAGVQMASGGSAANTIHGLAKMGIECAYIGMVGEDETGKFFEDDLISSGIKPVLFKSTLGTGKAVALISPDSERTFATSLGAAIELAPSHINENIFDGYDILHLEGYLVQNHSLIEAAAKAAKKSGLKISLDLASYNVVEANLDFLTILVKNYVDIVFANEEEAHAFTGKEAEKALHQIAEMAEIAVVKIGAKGSMIKWDNKIYKTGVIACSPIDTTGAGDLYASGFLTGICRSLEPEACGNLGALLAGKVIEGIGAKISDNKWKEIINDIKS